MSLPYCITVGCTACLLLCTSLGVCRAEERVSEAAVLAAIRKAATFYRTKVAVHGGYVYHYSLDLSQRWGEGLATPDQVWGTTAGHTDGGHGFSESLRGNGRPVLPRRRP